MVIQMYFVKAGITVLNNRIKVQAMWKTGHSLQKQSLQTALCFKSISCLCKWLDSLVNMKLRDMKKSPRKKMRHRKWVRKAEIKNDVSRKRNNYNSNSWRKILSFALGVISASIIPVIIVCLHSNFCCIKERSHQLCR